MKENARPLSDLSEEELKELEVETQPLLRQFKEYLKAKNLTEEEYYQGNHKREFTDSEVSYLISFGGLDEE